MAFSQTLPPTHLQQAALHHVQVAPKSNIRTSLGGSARARIYIRMALGTKHTQKMFPLEVFFKIAVLRYNLPTPELPIASFRNFSKSAHLSVHHHYV